MSIECAGHARVDAAPEACLKAVSDPTTWPGWARDLEKVKVRGVGPDGFPDRVEVTVELLGRSHRVLLGLAFDAERGELRANLLEGPNLEAFAASARFEPAGAGTRFSYELTVVLTNPPGGRVERMAGRKVETILTRDLVRWIERGDRRR